MEYTRVARAKRSRLLFLCLSGPPENHLARRKVSGITGSPEGHLPIKKKKDKKKKLSNIKSLSYLEVPALFSSFLFFFQPKKSPHFQCLETFCCLCPTCLARICWPISCSSSNNNNNLNSSKKTSCSRKKNCQSRVSRPPLLWHRRLPHK